MGSRHELPPPANTQVFCVSRNGQGVQAWDTHECLWSPHLLPATPVLGHMPGTGFWPAPGSQQRVQLRRRIDLESNTSSAIPASF